MIVPDHAAEDIRKGYLSRVKAVKLVKKYDTQKLFYITKEGYVNI